MGERARELLASLTQGALAGVGAVYELDPLPLPSWAAEPIWAALDVTGEALCRLEMARERWLPTARDRERERVFLWALEHLPTGDGPEDAPHG